MIWLRRVSIMLLGLVSCSAFAVRLKDISSIRGVHPISWLDMES